MIYFDKETDKKLLEATSEEEVKAIISSLPDAEKFADKTDLIMAEINRIRNNIDEEVGPSELDSIAGGAKLIRVDLSETQSCKATFYLEDMLSSSYFRFCTSNDFCNLSNEYDYHYTRYSNCKKGGRHIWIPCKDIPHDDGITTVWCNGYKCTKCDIEVAPSYYDFDE